MNKALYYSGSLLFLCCIPLKAQENVDKFPSIAFLEYLADMQVVDGNYYGPQDMNGEGCQGSIQKERNNGSSNEISNETNNEPNSDKDDEAKTNDKTATKQECKHHD